MIYWNIKKQMRNENCHSFDKSASCMVVARSFVKGIGKQYVFWMEVCGPDLVSNGWGELSGDIEAFPFLKKSFAGQGLFWWPI